MADGGEAMEDFLGLGEDLTSLLLAELDGTDLKEYIV